MAHAQRGLPAMSSFTPLLGEKRTLSAEYLKPPDLSCASLSGIGTSSDEIGTISPGFKRAILSLAIDRLLAVTRVLGPSSSHTSLMAASRSLVPTMNRRCLAPRPSPRTSTTQPAALTSSVMTVGLCAFLHDLEHVNAPRENCTDLAKTSVADHVVSQIAPNDRGSQHANSLSSASRALVQTMPSQWLVPTCGWLLRFLAGHLGSLALSP